MFVEFFYLMRSQGIKVGVQDWLVLMQALKLGLAQESLKDFYTLVRMICIKSEAFYDVFDRCFLYYFQGIENSVEVTDDLLKWLDKSPLPREFTQEEKERIKNFNLDELRSEFEKRLGEQKEEHNGGNHWVGTGGTSPFGHSGYHPDGLRVGGEGRNKSAMQVAAQRQFRNLRHDSVLGISQTVQVLKQLRNLGRYGLNEELSLADTIDATSKNAGEITLVMRPERRSQVKLLLLMDVGGSMDPYTHMCENLFSAAFAARSFKKLESFFFHNCVYDELYSDYYTGKTSKTLDVLSQVDDSWFCFIVGDAAMHPAELLTQGGAISYWQQNSTTGLDWLRKIKEVIPRTVWINPEEKGAWGVQSCQIIKKLFSMYPLSLEGLHEAIKEVKK